MFKIIRANVMALLALAIVFTTCAMEVAALEPSFDTVLYHDLKQQYDVAVENQDFIAQQALIEEANQLLDTYIEQATTFVSPRISYAEMYNTFFASAHWTVRDNMYSLSITPKFGYQWEPVSSYEDSWNALYWKHSPDARWTNTSSMKKQYLCHVNFAGGWKVPWNLEPSRTNVNPFTCN